MKLEHHALSNIFPMMNELQFAPFKEGMKRFGYDESKPITLFEGKILDGRNRNKSGFELGFKVPTKEFIPNGKTALDFVVQENLTRRHLSTGQLGFVSLKVYDALKEQYMTKRWDGDPTVFKDGLNEKRAEVVAKMFGIGRYAVTSALTIRKYNPSLMNRVMSGEINISMALKLMPKIRTPMRKAAEDKIAVEVLSKLNPDKFKIPLVYDSYEKFFGEHIKRLNDEGFIMQAVFCARKVYVQIVGQNEQFKTWGNRRSEHDFRLAVVGCMRDLNGI